MPAPVPDHVRVELFCGVVERATQRAAIQQGTIQSSFNISGQEGQPVQVSSELGDEEHVRSLLLDVRQLVMEGESVFFPAITNIVYRLVPDPELRGASVENVASWKRVMGGGGFGLVANGVNLSGLNGFRAWVYGGIIHSDPEQVALWNSLSEPFLTMVQVQVRSFMIDALKVAWAERNLIREAQSRGFLGTD